MGQPLVSIVTPSFNQGEFIRATIESVLTQDYPHIEYIVMDGGSTDQTASVAAEYAGRLMFISERDRGQSHAINKGFTMARGEIIAWLNSDDVLLPGAVAHAVRAFEAAPCAGAIYGDGYRMDREGRTTGRFKATEPFNLWKLVYLSDYVLQQSTFFRKAAVEAVGGLDEGLHYAMDWDLLIKLGKRFGLHYVAQDLGCLREYSDAKTFRGGGARIEEIRRVLERHTGLAEAPGYRTYGASARQQAAVAWFDRKLSTGFGRWLAAPYTAVLITKVAIAGRVQGYDSDGWASNCMKWMLPEGSGEVSIRGEVPTHSRYAQQELAAFAEGREVGRKSIGCGDFEFRFTGPEGPPRPLEFEIRAKSYRWGLGPTGKIRRMAFRFKDAQWVQQGNTQG